MGVSRFMTTKKNTSDVIIEMEKIKDMYCGLGQFCFHLGINILKNKHLKNNLHLYLPKDNFKIFERPDISIPLNVIHRKLHFLTPKSRVWHATHQDSPYYPSNRKTKYVLTIHDLNFIFEEHISKNETKRLENLLQKKINRASAITFISNFTKNLVCEKMKIPDIPLKTIYNGVALQKNENSTKPEFVPDGKFIFSIGTIIPKKNFHVLIEFMKKVSDFNLIIAGTTFHQYAKMIIETVKKEGLESRIIIPGKINESEKWWLHKNCEAFIFPSKVEGFGLPVVEAMNMGKPIFLSRLTSLPEIGGDDAYYFDNFKPDHMKEVFTSGLDNFQNDNEKKNRLIERSKQFCWKKTASDYLDLYSNL